MNIILIGYRGTGKSVVGKILAERLGMECVSMDEKIVEKAGMPISDIVANYGWAGFRDMESEVAKKLADCKNLIIDTGGGVIERSENIENLKKSGLVVWLKASVDVIVSRIKGDFRRPSLTGTKSFTEEVAEVLERRKPKYAAFAGHEIDTDFLTPEQVADKIIQIKKNADSLQSGEINYK